ncbi:MAG: type II toxin-antitoxin system PemK/MazF family toxin [Armatimonadetes bacterium]|nr:type II toxin-antitoxin system PemK/MazF family toxin [Armatimonadota bacterium]
MAMTRNPNDPHRGEVWVADLEPTVGDEIRKQRRVVVVGSDVAGVLRLRIVVHLTAWRDDFSLLAWMVPLIPRGTTITKPVAADCYQIRSISIDRFTERMGCLAEAEMDAITDAIAFCLDIEMTNE